MTACTPGHFKVDHGFVTLLHWRTKACSVVMQTVKHRLFPPWLSGKSFPPADVSCFKMIHLESVYIPSRYVNVPSFSVGTNVATGQVEVDKSEVCSFLSPQINLDKSNKGLRNVLKPKDKNSTNARNYLVVVFIFVHGYHGVL